MGVEGKPIIITKCGSCGGGSDDASLCGLANTGLTSPDIQKVHKTYEAGENIYFEGDSSDGVYCLKTGLIAIRKTDVNGNSAVVRLVQPGEAFGHRSFLANEKHAGTAEVLTEAKLCYIARTNLEHLMAETPDVAIRFTRRAASTLISALALRPTLLVPTISSARTRSAAQDMSGARVLRIH